MEDLKLKREEAKIRKNFRKIEEELSDIKVSHSDYEELERLRPKTRADCKNIPRPCPYISCKYNLLLERGSFLSCKEDESCYLDMVDEGKDTLDAIGKAMNLTRERIRQIERGSLRKFRYPARSSQLRDFHQE